MSREGVIRSLTSMATGRVKMFSHNDLDGIAFFNVNIDKGYGTAFRDFNSFLMKSPWFMERGNIRGKIDRWYEPVAPIRTIVGSEEQHGLGEDIFCLTGDTPVITNYGIYPIDQLVGRDVSVLTGVDLYTGKTQWSPPASVVYQGTKDVVED